MGLIVGLADKHEMKWAKDGKGQGRAIEQSTRDKKRKLFK